MIAENIKSVRKIIGKTDLIVVTKGRSVDEIGIAIGAGATLIGENRVDEAAEKLPLLRDLGCRFHFIGHLQSNKVRDAVRLFDVIQTIDSLDIAKKVDSAAHALGKRQEIFIQVNIGKEKQKSGVLPEGCMALAEEVARLQNVRLSGLMCIPPFSEDPEATRHYFRQMKTLFKRLSERHPEMKHLSMGMTNDYRIAIEEGSSMVRIGRGIFENEILNKDKK